MNVGIAGSGIIWPKKCDELIIKESHPVIKARQSEKKRGLERQDETRKDETHNKSVQAST